MQFARMGSIYMEHVVGDQEPPRGHREHRRGGREGQRPGEGDLPAFKGVRRTSTFTGSIEAREIPHGGADVIVCEALHGKCHPEAVRGRGSTLLFGKVKAGMMTSLRSKIGALLVKPALKEDLKSPSTPASTAVRRFWALRAWWSRPTETPKRMEVKNSIIQCVTFKEQDINGKIQESLGTAKEPQTEQ